MTTTQIKPTDHIRVLSGSHTGLTGTVTSMVEYGFMGEHYLTVKLDDSPMSITVYSARCELIPEATDPTVWLLHWDTSYEGTWLIDIFPTLESAERALTASVAERWGSAGALNRYFEKDVLDNGTVRWEHGDHTATAQPYHMSEILAKA